MKMPSAGGRNNHASKPVSCGVAVCEATGHCPKQVLVNPTHQRKKERENTGAPCVEKIFTLLVLCGNLRCPNDAPGSYATF
jgi:hypothetical protein